jgi:hypothetical protein
MTKLVREIPIAWSHVRDARKLVQEALADRDPELRDAAGMTMSELVENAMKYGDSTPEMQGARFTLSIDEQAISIEVQNGTSCLEEIDNLKKTIEAIAAAPDQEAREALYVARLQELLEDPTSGGRLGLYRIGFEGGFDLSCSVEGHVVTVMARRLL